MTVSTKRKSDEQDGPSQKRSKADGGTSAARDAGVEGFCTYNVKMHHKFAHWPPKLRSTIQQQFRNFLMQAAIYLRAGSGKRDEQDYTYRVIKGERIRSSVAGFNCTRLSNHSHLCDANKVALEVFTNAFDVPTDCGFVELETSLGDANGHFVHLHSAKAGDVSWGFDTHGCLSLYLAEKEPDKRLLKETVYYVERREFQDELVEIID